MKLEQGQIWKQGEVYYRIVEWARMHIEYKMMKDPATKEGTFHQLSKKEFCRLLKGAVLIPQTKSATQADEKDLGLNEKETAFAMNSDLVDLEGIH